MKSIGIASRPGVWLSERRLSSLMLIIAVVLLVLVVGGVFGYLVVEDMLTFGKFPAGVSIVGVDVSGLNKTQAVARCQEELAEIANQPLVVRVDDEEYAADPAGLGLELQYREMVDEAYEQAWSPNLLERMGRCFVNRPRQINVSLLATNNDELVQQFLQGAMVAINREPSDAYVDVTSGAPVIVQEKDGRQADFNRLLEDTKKALATAERTVNVQVTRTPAGLTGAAFGQLIVINLAEHRLSLYNRDQLLGQWGIACGSARYPTPVGIWKIVGKQRNPSWINPGTDWAKSMPPYIPPGPGNPLGTRALPLNASGVLIHGTSASGSIGSSVSHGCIRMHMRDVEQLFEMVEANTPVYIIRAAGNPGFDVTKRPFWWQ